MKENRAPERWESGSQMDWRSGFLVGCSPNDAVSLPAGHQLFATGTGVFLALGRLLRQAKKRRPRLHVPSFFCMDVVGRLNETFEISWYQDLPTDKEARFETLHPDDGDIVLAANLFGRRDGAAWREWMDQHDRVMLLEDHSHDPFSPWATTSQAHYTMASLRKTLPLPDGAFISSPKGLELPRPHPSSSPAASVKLTGMMLKHAYLEGASFAKDVYRRMEVESEDAFARDTGYAVSPFTSGVLDLLRVSNYRDRRVANFDAFKILNEKRKSLHWQLLFDSLPDGAAPFGIVLLCQNRQIRDALRHHLVEQNVFTAIHWFQAPEGDISSGDDLAIDIASRILTVPCDQRYNTIDMECIFERVASYAG